MPETKSESYTLKDSVDGTDVDYKKALDSVDKMKEALGTDSVDTKKAADTLSDG